MKKTAVISTLNEFPKEFNLDDFLEKLIVLEKIDAGIKDANRKNSIPHAELKILVKKWRR